MESRLCVVAGFFDGDGCICHAINKSWPTIYFSQARDSGIPPELEFVNEVLSMDAPITKLQKVDGRRQEWRLGISRRSDVARFLVIIEPHVIVKRNQVSTALALVRGRKSAWKSSA